MYTFSWVLAWESWGTRAWQLCGPYTNHKNTCSLFIWRLAAFVKVVVFFVRGTGSSLKTMISYYKLILGMASTSSSHSVHRAVWIIMRIKWKPSITEISVRFYTKPKTLVLECVVCGAFKTPPNVKFLVRLRFLFLRLQQCRQFLLTASFVKVYKETDHFNGQSTWHFRLPPRWHLLFFRYRTHNDRAN